MDRLQRARALYAQGEMHDALEAAQAACDQHPRDAEAWWLLAGISRYASLPGASDLAFRKAAALSRRHPVPHRVSIEAFEEMVRVTMEHVSPDARRRLEKVQVTAADLPSIDAIKAGDVDPDALSMRRRAPEDVLTLFKVNLENRSGNEAGLRKYILRELTRA